MNTMNSIKLERKHIEVICEVREYVCDAYDELELPANFDLVDAQEKKPKFVKDVMNWFTRRFIARDNDALEGFAIGTDPDVCEGIVARTDKVGVFCMVEINKLPEGMRLAKFVTKDLEDFVKTRDKKNGDNAFLTILNDDAKFIGGMNVWENNKSMNENMKRWKKERKAGNLVIKCKNNQEQIISGKTWYTCIVELDKEDYVYWFKSEENRNIVIDYVMN